MKKSIIVISILFMLLLPLMALGAGTVDKIGFVNARKIILDSNAGRKATEDYKVIFKDRGDTIQRIEAELDKLKDEYEKLRALPQDEILREKELTYQKKLREYQLLVKDSNEELQTVERRIFEKLFPEVHKVLQGIADREKYTMIIDISAIPVAYYAKDKDLTMRALEEFNKTYKP